jgi:ribonucleotide monophosphatase NagD (HAD superfamily)
MQTIFHEAKSRGMNLLCANPDIQVDVGEKRIFCAGALAKEYALNWVELSHYFGKPHARQFTIWHASRLATRCRTDDRSADRVLCIGDGIKRTSSVQRMKNLDSLFISGGLAAKGNSDELTT